MSGRLSARRPVYHPAVARRMSRRVLVLIYLAAVIGCVAMLIGPMLNDYAIGKDPGRALARVTSVSALETAIEYQDEEGVYHSPRTGLLYPSGLGVGQRVWITYARSNPELAKVEGRTWTLAIIPAFSALVVVHIIAALLFAFRRFILRQLAARR
ncbi:DUF3592 domain-containing protein [Corynebacterium sp. ES2794-CONJ1]|uniref:DUF3592 domain-containing protein n=1 Tax=unclassified Corynebacterium TaxID=2624378 RepID=UPI0021698E25|nr:MULTISPECIES: DUF3592 domain-containing protein [unclassified Corynebacterium]MCS4489697.1 DUF3592 domain-containing protein [Corynebacterium sp. ES2775-CONJ]MCS4491294.1 DUF3592 domain-containing protein [Corynebacterium sp. ES2715-CONJ3]MCU9519004.1 DUF3592 domain-containing protein [Corynebacterium sp. ES2794-CONJ1]